MAGRPQTASPTDGLHPLPFQAGVLIGIGGQPAILEVFDSPRTLDWVWPGLLSAAALDARGESPVGTPGWRARAFVETVTRLRHDLDNAVMGKRFRASAPGLRLAGLAWQGRAVHTVALNSRRVPVSA